MKGTRFVVVLGWLSLVCPASAWAQRYLYWQDKPGTWLVTATLGVTRYLGDMNERGDLAHLRPGAALSLGVAYRVADRLTVRADARLYYIRGSQQDTHLADNHLSFYSLNPDAWVGLQWDFWHPDDPNHILIPYALLGVGLTYMTPKAIYNGRSVSLAPLHTEGVAYNRLAPIGLYGLGVPIWATERFNVQLEGIYTHVFSDYLDDVSTVYPDRSLMDPLAAALSDRRPEIGQLPNGVGAKRGNDTRRDGYFILSGRLRWIITTTKQQQYRRSRRG